ncbi:MAG: SMI1/KNR4 family protein [Verrucomicrobiota bacterium]
MQHLSAMDIDWKRHIITLTEGSDARAAKRDASFFPPVADSTISGWEAAHKIKIPVQFRSFLNQSNGLEAQCGTMWPVLPFEDWETVSVDTQIPKILVRFGERENCTFLFVPEMDGAIFLGSPEVPYVPFAPTFADFLETIFRGGH